MAILSETNRVNYFKELPFYNEPIEKPEIKPLKNNDLLTELPFSDQPSIIKTKKKRSDCTIRSK